MRRRPGLRTALTLAACLAPAAVLCQVTAPSTRSQTRVLSLRTFRPEAVWHTTPERIDREGLSDALGDQVDYSTELLDVNHSPDPSYESDFEDYLVRKYQDRPIDLLIANGVTDEPGLFERYRGFVLIAVALLLLQTFLIAGLLMQRRNRRLVERSLRESEERFRVMADTAPVMIWRSGPDQRCDFFNKPWLEFRGRRLQDELGEGWTEGVHPDDLQRCLSIYTAAWPGREPFRMEYRLQQADGEYRWVLDTGVPRLGSDGGLLLARPRH